MNELTYQSHTHVSNIINFGEWRIKYSAVVAGIYTKNRSELEKIWEEVYGNEGKSRHPPVIHI